MPASDHPPLGAWRVVALLWVVGLLNYLDRVMITTMRESLKDAIPMSEAQFGLLTTGFLLVYGVLSPCAGFLADRFRRSTVIIVSLLCWSITISLTAHARTYEHLLASRLLMGVSEATFLPACLALIADYHPGSTRSLATGIVLGGVIAGSALGGAGGWAAERFGWDFSFRILGYFGFAYTLLLAVLLREAPTPSRSNGSPPQRGSARIRAAWNRLFRNSSYNLLILYWGLTAIATWMVIGWMPTYIQEHFRLSQGTAGLSTTFYLNIASWIGLIVGGAWADRWGRTDSRACIYVSAIGLVGSVPAILLVAKTASFTVAMLGLVAFGLANAFVSALIMPILCLVIDHRFRATGYGVMNFFACVAGGTTIYAGGLLRDSAVDISRLFQFGAAGLVVCAGVLLLIKPSDDALLSSSQA